GLHPGRLLLESLPRLGTEFRQRLLPDDLLELILDLTEPEAVWHHRRRDPLNEAGCPVALGEPRERVRHLLARGEMHVQVRVLDEALDRVDDVAAAPLDPLHRAEQVTEPEAKPRVALLRLIVDDPVEGH